MGAKGEVVSNDLALLQHKGSRVPIYIHWRTAGMELCMMNWRYLIAYLWMLSKAESEYRRKSGCMPLFLDRQLTECYSITVIHMLYSREVKRWNLELTFRFTRQIATGVKEQIASGCRIPETSFCL